MDLCITYCRDRRVLEARSSDLAGRVSELTNHLIALIGCDHRRFLSVRAECDATTQELGYANKQLENHRREHGC